MYDYTAYMRSEISLGWFSGSFEPIGKFHMPHAHNEKQYEHKQQHWRVNQTLNVYEVLVCAHVIGSSAR